AQQHHSLHSWCLPLVDPSQSRQVAEGKLSPGRLLPSLYPLDGPSGYTPTQTQQGQGRSRFPGPMLSQLIAQEFYCCVGGGGGGADPPPLPGPLPIGMEARYASYLVF